MNSKASATLAMPSPLSADGIAIDRELAGPTVMCAWCGSVLASGSGGVEHTVCGECRPVALRAVLERLKPNPAAHATFLRAVT